MVHVIFIDTFPRSFSLSKQGRENQARSTPILSALSLSTGRNPRDLGVSEDESNLKSIDFARRVWWSDAVKIFNRSWAASLVIRPPRPELNSSVDVCKLELISNLRGAEEHRLSAIVCPQKLLSPNGSAN